MTRAIAVALLSMLIWLEVIIGDNIFTFDTNLPFKDQKDLYAEIPDGLIIEGINDYDGSRRTPLMNAVRAGHLEAVKQLLKGGADANMSDGEGNPPLLMACERGFYDVASLLIDNKANVSQRNAESRHALYATSQSGHVDIARLLTSNGAEVDSKVRAGMTALMVASLKGYSKVVKALLDAGANPNITNDSGENALMLSAISPSAGVAITVGADGETVGKGEPDALQLLIQANSDIDARDGEGRTALIKLAIRGNKNISDRLVEAGANIDIKDDAGNTALTYALERGHHSVAQLLLAAGATIQTRYGPRMEAETRLKRERVLKARHDEELKRLGMTQEPEPAVVLKKSSVATPQ